MPNGNFFDLDMGDIFRGSARPLPTLDEGIREGQTRLEDFDLFAAPEPVEEPEIKGQPSRIEQIGSGIAKFGKILTTPGVQEALGRLGVAISAPGAPAQRIAAGIAEVGARRRVEQASARALSKVMAGEPLSREDLAGLSPTQQAQLQATEQRLRERREEVTFREREARRRAGLEERRVAAEEVGVDIAAERAEIAREQLELQERKFEREPTPEQEHRRRLREIELGKEVFTPDTRVIDIEEIPHQVEGSFNRATGEFTPDMKSAVPVSVVNKLKGTGKDPRVEYGKWFDRAVQMAARDPRVAGLGRAIFDADGRLINIQWDPGKKEEGARLIRQFTQENLKRIFDLDLELLPEQFLEFFEPTALVPSVEERRAKGEEVEAPITTPTIPVGGLNAEGQY